jgi:putative endonuclease
VDTHTRNDPRRRLGALGERLAREHLGRAGYAVVESNYRCRRGEIDVVAFGHGALVFCEVKTRVGHSRAGPANPLDGIGPGKRRRLRLLAREWLCERKGTRPGADTLRFDAIGVTVGPDGALLALEHVEGAF